MVKLSPQAEVVARKRYYLKNEHGEIIEDAEKMFRRVAKGVASIETLYNAHADIDHSEKEFYRIMAENKFLPNSPTLMNAGTHQGTLSACFVLPVEDSMEGIMKAATDAAMVQKFGGGTGFALSKLRPKGDKITTTHGQACIGENMRIPSLDGAVKFKDFKGTSTFIKEYGPVSKIHNNGVKDTVQLLTIDGYSLEATLDHDLMMLKSNGEFVKTPISSLKVGDKVTLIRDCWSEVSDFVTLDNAIQNDSYSTRRKIVKLPSLLSEKLAYVLGVVYADGHVRKHIQTGNPNGVIITLNVNEKKSIADKCTRYVRDIFGIEMTWKARGTRLDGLIGSSDIGNFLAVNSLLKEKSGEIRIPEAIWKSPKEVASAFIAGYFDGDGHVDGTRLAFTSVSKEFLQGIQQLSLMLGVPSKLSQHGKERIGHKDSWRLTYQVGSFTSEINGILKLSEKKVGWRPSQRPNSLGISLSKAFTLKDRRCIVKTMGKGGFYSTPTSLQTLDRISVDKDIEDIKDMKFIREHVVLSEISAINELGFQPVYDLTVEDPIHAYNANGFFVSNCGPIEVLKTLSRVSSMITQGGKRDGANMAVMDVHHPDILEFITCKAIEGEIHNFNISVGVTNDFMQAVKAGTHYDLIHPKYQNIVGELDAREVFRKIIHGAWRNGEPGMVFLDRINEDNKVQSEYGRMIATNPCGEQPLLPNESCNLGSINVSEFFVAVKEDEDWKTSFNWADYKKTIRLAIQFLDDVVDANVYATKDIEKMTKATRKVGLGIMGFADLLIQMRIAYDSELGREVGSEMMRVMKKEADKMSAELAEHRGNFSAWEKSAFTTPMRNACRLTVAPTGTISMLANTSSGIEPTFALAWKKQNVLEGETLFYTNKYFEKEDFITDEMLQYIAAGGSVEDLDLPEWAKETYAVSSEMEGDDHVLMQAAFQEHCDSGISKTINLPNEATEEDVATAYLVAFDSGCKGITVYRSGSRDKEVLVKESQTKIPAISDKYQKDLWKKDVQPWKPVPMPTPTIPWDQSGWDITSPMVYSKGGSSPMYANGSAENSNYFWDNLGTTYTGLATTGYSQVEGDVYGSPTTTLVAVSESVCCDSPMLVEESGCTSCKSCGWSKCHIA